ncbi:hypothetical protein C0993_006975 [Termitomyces sp. T159_Od127]|nr:hypothetical protein C0993_006975 [Termitomyces sp. T159_Od127]
MAEIKGRNMRTSSYPDNVWIRSRVHTSNDELVDSTLEKTWWKIDLIVLPMVAMFSILALLDRANIGNALLAGLQEDLQMTNYQFTIVLMVTFIPYLLMEFPINLILKSRPSDPTVCSLRCSLFGEPWLLCKVRVPVVGSEFKIKTDIEPIRLGVVRNQSDLLACRFFLGLFEGILSLE